MIDDRTEHLALPLPHPGNTLEEDVLRLRTLIVMLDTLLASDDVTLDNVQELVTAIKAANTELDVLTALVGGQLDAQDAAVTAQLADQDADIAQQLATQNAAVTAALAALSNTLTNALAAQDNELATALAGMSGRIRPIPANGVLPDADSYYTSIGVPTNLTLPDMMVADTFGLFNPLAVTHTATTADQWSLTNLPTTTPLVPLATATPHGIWGSPTRYKPRVLANSVGAVYGTAKLSEARAVAVVAGGCVAINLTTGTFGDVKPLAMYGSTHYVYSTGPASFICFFETANNNYSAVSGSLDDMTITLGAPQVIGLGIYKIEKLSNSLFVFARRLSAQSLQALSSVGTQTTLGGAIAVGVYQEATSITNRLDFCRATDTSVLIAYTSDGSTSNQIRLNIATVTGVELAMGTQYSGSAEISANGIMQLVPYVEGSAYLLCGRANTATIGKWLGITIDGNGVIACGAVATTAANVVEIIAFAPKTGFFYPRQPRSIKWNNTTILVANSNGVFPVTIAGVDVTVGSPLSIGANWLVPSLDGASIYAAKTAASYQIAKLNVAGQSVSAAWTVATPIACPNIPNDSICDGAVKYGGTWYEQRLEPAMLTVLTPTKWIGTDYKIYGDIT